MKRRFSTHVAVALFLIALARPAGAQNDYLHFFGGDSFASGEWGKWEFGVDYGQMYATQKKSFTHVIPNQRAYALLQAESVGDEVAEGFAAPPIGGNSNVSATIPALAEIGLHVYREFTPWISWGLDGGYGFKRGARIDDRGIYVDRNFLHLTYDVNIVHIAAPFKIGKKLGAFRPYLLAGPGLYLIYERAAISFNDADDPQLSPLAIVSRNAPHFGLAGGAGFDWHVDRGIIALELQYHRVLAGVDRVNFALPKIRFGLTF